MKEDVVAHGVLETMLMDYGLITDDQLALARERADLEETTLREAILWNNFLSDEELGKLFAEHFHLKYVNLRTQAVSDDVLHIIPEIVARKNKAIAFSRSENTIDLAVADPRNIEFYNFLERKTGANIRLHYATDRDIIEAFGRYQKTATEAFEEILKSSVHTATEAVLTNIDPPIIRVVDALFGYAYQNKASDIHLEPRDYDALVRFRIDGILHDITKLPKELHPQILSRIKVLAQLRTDEHAIPQDGKLQVLLEGEMVDIRVSIIPLTNGEKAVLRLLSNRSRQFSLTNLGLGAEDLLKTQEAYQKPYGMVLVTGPTGCGKTTTLYSFLKLLNRRNVNIMTIEDPVEYDIEGTNQIQVNPDANLTFSTGLRSILRQDPNIILVGEIRDAETAGIAINLAMTGHLVLSTLHTNNAATAILRLLELGVEPFLIASTINVIVAQRLVRKIHQECRVSQEITVHELIEQVGSESAESIMSLSGQAETLRVYRGKGCSLCHGTGYFGRTGIFEVLVLDEVIRKAITERKTAKEIETLARERGMRIMLEDGFAKIRSGETTIDEVMRVSRE